MITELNGNNYQANGAHPGGTAKNPLFELLKSALEGLKPSFFYLPRAYHYLIIHLEDAP
jgi:hypothetical protein